MKWFFCHRREDDAPAELGSAGASPSHLNGYVVLYFDSLLSGIQFSRCHHQLHKVSSTIREPADGSIFLLFTEFD